MKKIYMQPQINVVLINTHTTLLTGSGDGRYSKYNMGFGDKAEDNEDGD